MKNINSKYKKQGRPNAKKGLFPRGEKGIALLSVYLTVIAISGVSMTAFGRSFMELRNVEREYARVQSYAAAEAALQSALAQIGTNAYTGFINELPLNPMNFQDVSGNIVGTVEFTMDDASGSDWITIRATGGSGWDQRTIEARVFLDSNFSKYVVYANTPRLASGTNAQYGEPDVTDENNDGVPDYPRLVSSDEDERPAIYITGDWDIVGPNVKLYGDAHVETNISGNPQSDIYGDSYVTQFQQGAGGVSNGGILGGLVVNDGYDDDVDRNNDHKVDATDYPDHHDLTVAGEGDAHAVESLIAIDHNFYASHNNTPAFAGSTPKNRYLQFVPNPAGGTQIVEFDSPAYKTQKATYDLPTSGIVYIKGDAYVKGEIKGRVTVVSTDDIFFTDNMRYENAGDFADAGHSMAFLAKDKVYFLPETVEVSGILYAENSSGSASAFDASQKYVTTQSGGYFVTDTSKNQLLLHGNRVMNGSSNLSIYNTRVYGYDPNLKIFRPIGLPVFPDLRVVREIDNAAVPQG